MSIKRLAALFPAVVVPAVLLGQSPQLVDIGTHKLDVLRAGTGTPTIVFEAGLGDDGLDDWKKVWPSAAQMSSVVVYSRSGNGRSQLGPGDHSARTCATELHALLAHLDLKPPYILVGRSYGGILVRLYTSLYPNEVAGMVLVDATHEQQVRRWGAIDSTYPAAFRTYFDSVLKTLQPGADAAETAALAGFRRAINAIDPAVPVTELMPLTDQVKANFTAVHLGAVVLLVAAGVALFLTGLGLYGVISYIVERRTREIGVRIAIGATPFTIVVLMLRQGLAATLAGGAAGIAIAALSARLLAAYLVGIEPGDRVAFIAAALGVTAVAVVACCFPARRAARIDPMTALRVD